MLAVSELVDRIGVVSALDAGIGPIKTRDRGLSGGQLLVSSAGAQLLGQVVLAGLDRVRGRRRPGLVGGADLGVDDCGVVGEQYGRSRRKDPPFIDPNSASPGQPSVPASARTMALAQVPGPTRRR